MDRTEECRQGHHENCAGFLKNGKPCECKCHRWSYDDEEWGFAYNTSS